MKIRSWLPVALLGFTAFGCGVDQKLLGPAPASQVLRGSLATPAVAGRCASPGAVYTMTNAATGNAIVAYERSANGTLGMPQSYPTGGSGSGASLGNQGALALGQGNHFLYVVNAGSNDLSMFRVGPHGLELLDRVPAGGDHPVSVTTRGDLVYVLDAGGAGNIQGFRVSPAGAIHAIAGSNKPLSSAAAGAAEIGFTPDGTVLVVSEKATNTLSVYAVAANGSAAGPVVQASSGPTPYGFSFAGDRTLVISEAFGGAAGASAVSSWRVARGGRISLVSGSVPTNQTAACWVAVDGNGRFAYAANAGSSSLTGYAVGAGGALARLAGPATPVAMGPTDLTFSDGSRFLYVLSGGAHAISAFTVDADGRLEPAGVPTTTPAGVNGLAAR